MATSLFPSNTVAADLITLDVRVTGPDCDELSDGDVRRLFPGSTLTGAAPRSVARVASRRRHAWR